MSKLESRRTSCVLFFFSLNLAKSSTVNTVSVATCIVPKIRTLSSYVVVSASLLSLTGHLLNIFFTRSCMCFFFFFFFSFITVLLRMVPTNTEVFLRGF